MFKLRVQNISCCENAPAQNKLSSTPDNLSHGESFSCQMCVCQGELWLKLSFFFRIIFWEIFFLEENKHATTWYVGFYEWDRSKWKKEGSCKSMKLFWECCLERTLHQPPSGICEHISSEISRIAAVIIHEPCRPVKFSAFSRDWGRIRHLIELWFACAETLICLRRCGHKANTKTTLFRQKTHVSACFKCRALWVNMTSTTAQAPCCPAPQ